MSRFRLLIQPTLFSSQEPSFAKQVAMQQAPPLPPLKPKGKEQEAKELAVAEHAQPDDGQPASRRCVHLCAGTAITSVRPLVSNLLLPISSAPYAPSTHPAPSASLSACTVHDGGKT